MPQHGSCLQTAFTLSCISRAPQGPLLPGGYWTPAPWVPRGVLLPSALPPSLCILFTPLNVLIL